MADMKDKFKGFMNKVSSSSSSSKFKGQGRVLGSSSSGPANPIHARYSQNTSSKDSVSTVISKPSAEKEKPVIPANNNKSESSDTSTLNRKQSDGFDPFDSFISSGNRSQNGYSLNSYECPICGQCYGSEEEVSVHVDICGNNSVESSSIEVAKEVPNNGADSYNKNELEICIGTFLSGKISDGSLEVVLKLFRNISREPENSRFRKIRMSNPKIREAIGDVAGGVELLELVGFQFREEDGEMWAAMEVPTKEGIDVINKVIALLEPPKVEEEPQKKGNSSARVGEPVVPNKDEPVEPKKIDRQVRVFFSVPESVAAKIELPDSFYNLSLDEMKTEADMKKKRLAESQLLIPKSLKEKQAQAAKRKYRRTAIRIQFPDGTVLQGIFAPWETTSSLYEFVSSSLKEQCLEFELLHPVPIMVKRQVIPHFPAPGEKPRTLEEEHLVPSVLIKFRPIETDSIVFTGLCNELLEISEPLLPGLPLLLHKA